jgi:hypothetical protein
MKKKVPLFIIMSTLTSAPGAFLDGCLCSASHWTVEEAALATVFRAWVFGGITPEVTWHCTHGRTLFSS